MKVDTGAPAFVVKGDDEVLRRDAVSDLVDALVGDGDRSLIVEELDSMSYDTGDGMDISPIVDALQTPPFLTDRRVVLARQAGVFSNKDAVAPIVAWLADPLPSTALVLVWERAPQPGTQLGQVPKSLLEAVKKADGVVIDTKVGRSRGDRAAWIAEEIRGSGLSLDKASRARLEAHVGEDLDRVRATLSTLIGAFGPGASVSVDDLEPYLGSQGQVAPWDLTDAIDRGDVAGALAQLERMIGAGARHPLQVLSTLHGHYSAMLRLDGAGVGDERTAAELLGMRGGSTFRAGKALTQGRRLGSARLKEFIQLIAQADLDLKGAKGLPPELAMEVLVARLAGRSRTATGTRGART